MNAILNTLRRMFRPAPRPSAPRGIQLRLEDLEERCVLSYPATAIVAIHTDWSNGTYSEGTGAMVDPNVVLTAGHMLYDPARGQAVDSYVFADTISLTGSVTWSTGSQWMTFNSYVNDVNWQLAHKNVDSQGDPRHGAGDGDVALIWLNNPIGNTTGWFGLGSTDPYNWTNAYLNTMGYPGARDNGWQLTAQYGPISGSINGGTYQGSAYPYGAFYPEGLFPFSSFYFPNSPSNIQMQPGQSGSPLFTYNSSNQSATIYGVMDVEDDTTGTGYAEQITGPVLNDLETWIANNNSSSGGDGHQEKETQPSSLLPTQTTVQGSPASPVSYGVPVTFTAYVSAPGVPTPTTGTVTFYDNGRALGTVSLKGGFAAQASASFTASALAVGSHTITAVYSGGGGYQSSTSAAITGTVTVGQTFVGLHSSTNATVAGQPVTFTAYVGGAGSIPTGTVTFYDGDSVLGAGQLTQHTTGLFEDAYTTFTTSTLGVGSHTITAVYGGDSNHQSGASTALTVTVKPAQPDPVFALFADGSLRERTTAGWQELSPAGTILSISAITDAQGNDDVFAVTADSHLWEHTPAGWAMLSSGSFQQLSAATNKSGNAVVFAVLTDDSLWEYSSQSAGGWARLSPAGTVLSISAITDASGNDDVYAVTADHHLWEHTPAGWALLSAGSFQSVSAGLNGAGQAVAYGVLTDNSLWEYNPAFADGWRNLSPAGTVLAADAAGPDQVFAITADQHLWQYTLASGWSLTSAGSFASIAGEDNGGAGEVFAVLTDGSLWQYTTAWALLDGAAYGGANSLAAAAPRRG
jgi:V8-like Glu-specific endopeptidase